MVNNKLVRYCWKGKSQNQWQLSVVLSLLKDRKMLVFLFLKILCISNMVGKFCVNYIFLFFPPNTVLFISVDGWEGTSLLSGGRESVLVEWRDATEKNKEFLPRLGATIEHISVSPAGDLFCTSHSDNSKSDFVVRRQNCTTMEWKKKRPKTKRSVRFNEHFFLPFFLFSAFLFWRYMPPNPTFSGVFL